MGIGFFRRVRMGIGAPGFDGRDLAWPDGLGCFRNRPLLGSPLKKTGDGLARNGGAVSSAFTQFKSTFLSRLGHLCVLPGFSGPLYYGKLRVFLLTPL